MTPHPKLVRIWADMAAVPEVRAAFALEGVEKPEEFLWANADGVILQFLNAGEDGPGTLFMLRGRSGPEPVSLLLVRTPERLVALPEDQDIVGCRLPICDGESLMFADDDTAACANRSCPNYNRWH